MVKNPAANAGDKFDPRAGKSPWRRKWQNPLGYSYGHWRMAEREGRSEAREQKSSSTVLTSGKQEGRLLDHFRM